MGLQVSPVFGWGQEATGGRGVDVVLNSLPGEAVSKGLEALAAGGRFVEIGKRDIYGNRRLGLLPFRNNLSFQAVDLDKIIRENPAEAGRILRLVLAKLRQGVYSPLPFRAVPLALADDAFRSMAQARHVGKLVITVGDHAVPVSSRTLRPEFRADGAYLVTGGFGGFGLRVARWLAEGGAGSIALMGRGGPGSEEARQTLAALEAGGVRVAIIRGDVSRGDELAAALDRVRAELGPLRGVFHAAMVLDDGLLVNLDAQRLRRVLDPKVKGAWNLHVQTRLDPLDAFVLFSSVSSLIGNRGQANYAAANAFLDSFCHYRRGLGLPALTVNWGFLGETGVLAADERAARRFEEQGIRSFTPVQALDALDRLLRQGATQMAVLNVDWARLLETQPGLMAAPKFCHLAQGKGPAGHPEAVQPEGEGPLVAALFKAPPDERAGLLETALAEQTARILGASAAKIDRDRPLTEYGIDSLMAVELRNWVDNKLKITLPTMEIMRGPTVAGLSARLLKTLADEGDRSRDAARTGEAN